MAPGPAVGIRRGEHDDAVAARQAQGAMQRGAVPVLDARDGAGGEERQQLGGGERLAHRQLQLDGAGR